jgi:hypothetical protein
MAEWYTFSFRPNRIWRMGMIRANENKLKKVDRMLLIRLRKHPFYREAVAWLAG